MNEDFGTQGGFGDLIGASANFSDGASVFKTSVGEWTFGVLALKKIFTSENFKSWTEGSLKLTGVLGDLTDIFTKAKLADVVADLGASLYDTRKSLEANFGLFGDARGTVVDALKGQTEVTNKFGIRLRDNLASFEALAQVFGTTQFDVGLAQDASIMAKSFQMSTESAAEIVYRLNQFGGLAQKEIQPFAENLNKEFYMAGLSTSSIGEAMEGASKSMYRLQLNTQKGQTRFARMAATATKMGISVDHMVDAMDQFRSIPSAIEGSVTASLAGLNLTAMQLLATARGGDPSVVFTRVIDHLQKFTDAQGNLSQIGIDIADQLGPMINMDRGEIVTALHRLSQPGMKSLDYYKSMNDRLFMQQKIQEKLENVLYEIQKLVYPIMDPLIGILEWMTQNVQWTKRIAIGVGAIALIMKNRQFLGAIGKAFASGGVGKYGLSVGGGMQGVGEFLKEGIKKQFGFGKISDAADDGDDLTRMAKKKARAAKKIKGATEMVKPEGPTGKPLTFNQQKNLLPMQNEQLAKQTKLMNAQSKQMLASAVPMLAFAAATIILAKAFKMFGEVNWKEAKWGIGVITIFGGVMVALGATMTATAPMLLAASAMMGAFSLAVLGLGKGIQWAGEGIAKGAEAISGAFSNMVDPIIKISDLNLAAIGLGLVSLSASIGAFSLSMIGVAAISPALAIAGAAISGLALVLKTSGKSFEMFTKGLISLREVVAEFSLPKLDFGGVFNNLTFPMGKIVEFGNMVVSGVTNIFNNAAGVVVNFGSTLSNAISGIIGNLMNVGQGMISSFTNTIGGAVSGFMNFVSNGISIFKEAFSGMIEGVVGGFQSIAQTIISLGKDGVSQNLVMVGAGLAAIAGGLAAISGAGIVGGILSAFGAEIGIVSIIDQIGEAAIRNSAQISTLSVAMNQLAESSQRVQAVEAVKEVAYKVDETPIERMKEGVMKLFAKGPDDRREAINNNITIELDGTKLARQIVKTTGVRGA